MSSLSQNASMLLFSTIYSPMTSPWNSTGGTNSFIPKHIPSLCFDDHCGERCPTVWSKIYRRCSVWLLSVGPFSQKTFWHVTVGKAGVKDKSNDGWIPFSCFSFRVLVLCSVVLCTLSWLTGTLEYNEAPINVISDTCAFPAMTSQNVCCEKSLSHSLIDVQQGTNLIISCWYKMVKYVDFLYTYCKKSSILQWIVYSTYCTQLVWSI